MVRAAIQQHIDPDDLTAVALAERSERDILRAFADEAAAGGGR
jgi:hypothetical protein